MVAMLTKSILVLSFLTSVFRAKGFPVGSKENPGKSCKDILKKGGAVTKTYFINLEGKVFEVYCDQTTDGGGWTLVYSYTFMELKHFNSGENAVTPRPTWPIPGNVRMSTTPPTSETDYNAMSFPLWTSLGSEVLLKSNINNWYACSDGTGSIVRMRTGSIDCRLVNNYMRMCEDIVPNAIQKYIGGYLPGPNILKDDLKTPKFRSMYYLNQSTKDDGWPSQDPCGVDTLHKFNVTVPRGNCFGKVRAILMEKRALTLPKLFGKTVLISERPRQKENGKEGSHLAETVKKNCPNQRKTKTKEE